MSIVSGCGEKKSGLPRDNETIINDTNNEYKAPDDSLLEQMNKDSFISIPKEEKEKRYYNGQVVYLTKIFLGDYSFTDKSLMKLLASKGQPIVFFTGEGENGTIYYVYNKDNQTAAGTLAEYSDSREVSIYGKVVILNGLNILIAEKIERIK